MGERLGGVFIPPFAGLGIIDDDGGRLRGGFIVRAQNAATCELSVYSEAVLTHGIARGLFRFVFDELKFARCVINSPKSNKVVKRAAPKMGFHFEGVAKNFYGPGVDALQFSMTPDTCRWIDPHGKRLQIAEAAEAR